jgi:bacillopeptidase F
MLSFSHKNLFSLSFSFNFIGWVLCISSLGAGKVLAQKETFFVQFRRQANLDSLAAIFRQEKTSVSERARITLRHLLQVYNKSKAEAAQVNDLTEGGVVEHFWIVNGVAVHTTRSRISQVEALPFVDKVYTPEDLVFRAILPREPSLAASEKAIGAAEPGLEAIGARALWALGYTGRGRLVLSFDTGVWPQHPAISRGFLGHYRPYYQAWKSFHGVEEPADKSGSHGTHTIGTMLGLDPANADTIGVAFHAYYMAMDPIVVNLADTLPFVQLMAANQWALNPDGDTATTDDIPDVICNSWGRPPGGLETSFCSGIAPQMLQVLELAGIASEYSAGNDGPDSATASAPAYVPLSPVNAFSVGAVNANTTALPIASFSSRGPTPCPASGILQIKPEVVAPGVNVRSCVGQSGYAYYSGTSMAGPHVAGALLLLKEAFPYLPGEILKEALYQTALDLGPPGEDNTYGRGIINVALAFNWLVNQGYVPVPPTGTPDLVISAVNNPDQPLVCSASLQPQITLANIGSTAYSGVLNFQAGIVQSPGSFQTVTLGPVNLAPGAQTLITAPFTLTPQPGLNELWIRIWGADSSLQEPDRINNERNVRFWYAPPAAFPFTEQFEDTTLRALHWYVINPDNNKTWTLASTGGQASGSRSARMDFYGYPPQNQKDYLISPQIPLPAGGPVALFFDYAYKFVNSSKRDSILIKVSTDCGVTFQTVAKFPGDSLNSVPASFSGNFVPSESSHWRTRSVDLSSFAQGQPILLSFYTSNRSGSYFYLDNLHLIASGANLIASDITQELRLWPNPAHDFFYLASGEEGTIQLIGVDGRIILKERIFSGLNTINVTDLLPGLYLIIFETAKSRKFVKLVIVR